MQIQVGSAPWTRMLAEGAAALGVRLDASQVRLLSIHARELLKWNRSINLTRITDPLEVAVKHFLDSLAAAPVIGPEKDILDIGTGGGFPGLPLKVALPDAQVTLVDSVRKKVSFLKHVIRETRLAGIKALQGRIEDLAEHPGYAQQYEVVISRALSPLSVFVRQALPFLSPKGILIAMKAGRAAQEIRALKAQHQSGQAEKMVRLVELRQVVLPVLNLKRHIVVLKPVAPQASRLL